MFPHLLRAVINSCSAKGALYFSVLGEWKLSVLSWVSSVVVRCVVYCWVDEIVA